MKDETEGFLEVIRDELKNNISIMGIQLFMDKDAQNRQWPGIVKELEANTVNMPAYKNFIRSGEKDKWWQIGIQHIKLCLRFYVEI